MMATDRDWRWDLDYTVADQEAIEALDEDTRAVVERYVQAMTDDEPYVDDEPDAEDVLEALTELGYVTIAAQIREKLEL
jgi:hypothetical protein